MVLLINYLENSESVAFADVAVEGDQLIRLPNPRVDKSYLLVQIAHNKATRERKSMVEICSIHNDHDSKGRGQLALLQ